MNTMLKLFTKTINNVVPDNFGKHLVTESPSVELRGFTGSSASFLLAGLAESAEKLLLITPEPESAAALASDLEQLADPDSILLFPSTGRKPYDRDRLDDPALLMQRSEVLEKVAARNRYIVIASADAISEKLISAKEFQKRSILISKGDEVDPQKLREELAGQGYEPVNFVDRPGEFAVRGGIVDVFPFAGDFPVRLEFFGNEVDSIREFDPDSQRSVSQLDETRFVPNSASNQNGVKQSLFDYLVGNVAVCLKDPDLIREKVDGRFTSTEQVRKERFSEDLPPAKNHYLSVAEYDSCLEDYPILAWGSFTQSLAPYDETFELGATPHPEFNGSFKLLSQHIDTASRAGQNILILCNNRNQLERFEDLLGEPDQDRKFQLAVGSIHEGFQLPGERLALLTDHQIFNRYHRPALRSRKRVKGSLSFKELRDLNIGDYVVHVDYGIGKFAGFKIIEVKNSRQEAAVIKYRDDSTLYVNVASIHKLQKFSGKEGTAPRLSKLGSAEWARKKHRTKSKVKDLARDLIRLYAKRKSEKAHSFSGDSSWQTELEAGFEYEETPDQMAAIEAVKKDMESEQPMDRLVCGDVGFGKTEVAVRAAFKAVTDQKQVVVLVPTTILADQHFKTFSRRLRDFPVEIEMLSRFRSTAEQKKILKKLNDGKIDILIGTHRVVSKDVKFKELGLLIIDEEQRFGVAVKEKLKSFRASVDVLTLTATPIPRTLQFSLMGARDLSIIHTPPANRQPVYTEIHTFSHDLIHDAIVHETSRGGQVFFIHNRLKNIDQIAEMVRQLVPNVRVNVAHGKMRASTLEKIIGDFYSHKFDVLVSTNIVENGIDISNANTIVINNANHFGLSELHQLRGRVGRSNRKAYCYLLTPPIRTLTTEARKRLSALEEHSDLGAGFNIAMRDLDIRGAGDILGAEQSGFINDVGFEMYSKILDDAVKEIKYEEFGELFEDQELPADLPDTQIDFDHSALLESDYIEDSVERVNLYRKLAGASDPKEMDEWKNELEDRFGPLPRSAENLLLAARIKYWASRLYMKKVTIRAERIWLLCPENDSSEGEIYYSGGLFQQQLNALKGLCGDQFEVVQKKEKVRLVVHDIDGLEEAYKFLEKLYRESAEKQEVTA